MANSPDRETLRKLLSALLPTDSDLEALCIDRFPETAGRFTGGMSRVEKTNLLLLVESADQILSALQERAPERYDRQQRLLDLPLRSMGTATVSTQPQPKPISHPDRPVPITTQAVPLPLSPQLPQDLGQPYADVVIVTALKDDEYDEARKVKDGLIGDWSQARIDGTEVAFADYEAADGQPLRIAMTWATRMRGTAAADVAGRLLDRLGAGCVAMCGVCAGRRGDVQPGDVIIADLVYRYDTGALRVEYDEHGQQHERFKADPDPLPLAEAILHRAQAFRVVGAPWIHERPLTLAAQCDWVLAQLNAGQDPLIHADSEQRCPAWSKTLERLKSLGYVTENLGADIQLKLTGEGTAYIRGLLLKHRRNLPTTPPWHLHIAPIATGGSVMRDPKLFDRLSETNRKVLGVEMEAAAIAATAHARNLPWVVMKGVMDHADHDKDDLLKRFAARASAECLIRFLRENPLRGKQRSNRPPAAVQPNRSVASGTASSHLKTTATVAPRITAPVTPLAVTPPVPRDLAVVHAELKKKLEAVLRESPALVKALHGYSTPTGAERDPVKAIANGLTLRHARDVVADLNELTKQDSTLRVAVVKLLGHVLPLAVDWDGLLAQAEAQKVQQDVLELPLRTMTLAEVINARLDGRSCLLVPGTYDMEGVAHVRLPSVAYAPMFDADGQGLAHAVLSNLWQEQQTSQTLLPDREEWQQIGRSTTTKDEFVAAAETEINKRGRKLNRYLLFMDARLAAAGIDEQTLDAWWNIAHHALQQTLPGLRLVRLKGREAEWKKECGLISDIRGLHTP